MGKQMKLLVGLVAAGMIVTTITAMAERRGPREAVDVIYKNATVITMNSSNEIAQAVAVKDGRIVAVGRNREMRSLTGPGTRVVNLHRKTLLPGFYDAHSHIGFTGIVDLLQVILNSPPIGTMENIGDVIAALSARASETPAGGWVQGFGYDDTLLAELRHPTRDDLDQVSTVHPIYITHTSGHLAVANSLALQLAGIDKDTPQPVGGVIRKDPVTGEPTGVLEEAPAMGLVSSIIPPATPQQLFAAIAHGAKVYAAQGVTTGNSGASSAGFIGLFDAVAQAGLLPIRVVLWPTLEEADAAYAMNLGSDLLTVGGVKDFADGSIQGYTGYLSEPYHVQPEGETDYRGFPRYPLEVLKARTKEAHDKGYQSIIHGNGDAAIEDILDAWEEAQEANPREDTRNVVIHSQMMREDQLDRMEELGAIPSFFVLHTYYWGDRHWNIFMGPDRAARMSPARSAVDRGMPFTIHADTPVVPMDPLLLVWSAVNRISSNGNFIGVKGDDEEDDDDDGEDEAEAADDDDDEDDEGGLDQRITPLQALRATTIYAAYQNFEEDIKGSIEPGKLADMVVLSDNPLTVDPMDIRDIQVLETIVGGNTVYKSTN